MILSLNLKMATKKLRHSAIYSSAELKSISFSAEEYGFNS
jgi:hypothetical protein